MEGISILKIREKQQFRSCNKQDFHKKCFTCDYTVRPSQKKRRLKLQKLTTDINLPVTSLDDSKHSSDCPRKKMESEGTNRTYVDLKPDKSEEKTSETAVITTSVINPVNKDVPSVRKSLIIQRQEMEQEEKSALNNENKISSINDHSNFFKADGCSVTYSKMLSVLLNKPGKCKIQINRPRCKREFSRSRGGKFSSSFSIHSSFKNGVRKIFCVLRPVSKMITAAPQVVTKFTPKTIDISHIVHSSNSTYELNGVTRKRLVQYLHDLQKNGTVYTWDLFDSENHFIRECAYDAITLQVDEDLAKI